MLERVTQNLENIKYIVLNIITCLLFVFLVCFGNSKTRSN